MIRPTGLLTLFLALLLYAGLPCAYGGEDAVLATIGDVPITQSEFEQYIQSGLANASMDEIHTNQSAYKAALNAFFDLKVTAAKARQDKIDRELTFQKASQLMEMKLLVKAITERDRAKLLASAEDSSDPNKLRYMNSVKAEVDLKTTDVATNDSPLVFTWFIKTNAVLATLGGKKILESDFRWFLKDAFRPEQRPYVFEQPGARRRLLNSYLDMRALAAKARKDGLDRKAGFMDVRSVMEDKLLAEFLQERDHKMPWELSGSDLQKNKTLRKYYDQMRSEVQFKMVLNSSVSK